MDSMEKILVSACLLGAKVRYHGGDAASLHPTLRRWQQEGRLVAVCPEVDGGLETPRPPAEIVGPDAGSGVVARVAFVRTSAGADVTRQFLAGAARTLETAQRERVRVAILKEGSPSCGSSFVYDGTFSGTRAAGTGVTAALLAQNGIRVFSEAEIDQAAAWLSDTEENERHRGK
jgi:uncharacterized protein YbbK (DUF523 family)